MMRIIFLFSPRSSASFSRLTPASIETNIPSDTLISSSTERTTFSIICGFTPRKTKRLSASISCAVAARQPIRFAAAAELAGLLHDTATFPPPTFFTAASASAPPIFPAPINPASYFFIIYASPVLSCHSHYATRAQEMQYQGTYKNISRPYLSTDMGRILYNPMHQIFYCEVMA